MKTNTKSSIIGSVIAFLLATSCRWLPTLIITIGGGPTLLGISNGLEKFSRLFMVIGIGFLGLGVYHYQKRKMEARDETLSGIFQKKYYNKSNPKKNLPLLWSVQKLIKDVLLCSVAILDCHCLMVTQKHLREQIWSQKNTMKG